MTTPDDLAAAKHLGLLERDVRRANGQVYTPHYLADFVLNQALPNGKLPKGPALDPACGGGVFLRALVRRLYRAHKRAGLDVAGDHREKFLGQVKETVWGIDVDPVAVELSREALRSETLKLSPGPLPAHYFDTNVLNANFLFDDIEGLLPAIPQLVIGNPPYVSVDRLEEEAKLRIRQNFPLARGRIDLYTVFMERSASLLTAGGRMTFITPDKFLVSESSRALRESLSQTGSVRSVTLFASHRLFGDAATVPCVTVWDRVQDSRRIRLSHAHVDAGEAPTVSSKSQYVPASRFKGTRWNVSRAHGENLRTRLTDGHRPLSELISRISAGPATGYNPAFVLNNEAAAALDQELLHPTIRGRDIQRGEILGGAQVMLVPYKQTEHDKLELIDINDYPATKAWLEQHKTALLERHCVREWGKAWWDLHDPITFPLHSTQKIVFPDVARSNRFALDHGRFVPQHSAYFIIPHKVSAPFLTALLNSSCQEYLIRSHAPVVKDGFSRYRKQFLFELPIPIPTASVQDEVIHALSEGSKELLDKLVADLFNVDIAEVEDALGRLPIARD